MTLSPSKIIRGASIDGLIFCDPSGRLEERVEKQKQEQEHLKTLEDFWYSKGAQEGRAKGFEEGHQEGFTEGHKRGLQEGKKQGHTEGHQEGLNEGLSQGKAEAQQELEALLLLAKDLVKQVQMRHQESVESSRGEIVRFCIAVCEHLLRKHLENPEHLQQVIGALLDQATPILKKGPAQLFLSPEDLTRLTPHLVEVADTFSALRDDNLHPGDVRLETPMGLINFDVTRQLDGILHRVLEDCTQVEPSP